MDFKLVIAPVTLIIIELLKAFNVNKKYLSLIAVLVGGILGVLYAIFNQGNVFAYMIDGIISGAASSGLYEVVDRNLLSGFQKQ